jgi:hypothetical protein
VPCHQVCIRPIDAGGALPGPLPGPPLLPRNERDRRCWMQAGRPPDSNALTQSCQTIIATATPLPNVAAGVTPHARDPICASSAGVGCCRLAAHNEVFCRPGEPARVSRRPTGRASRARRPGRVRGRPGLAVRRDDQRDDHQDRSSGKYQDYGGGAHKDLLLACLSLPVLQREPGSERMIARRRIVQVDPPASARANRAPEINHDGFRLLQPDAASVR